MEPKPIPKVEKVGQKYPKSLPSSLGSVTSSPISIPGSQRLQLDMSAMASRSFEVSPVSEMSLPRSISRQTEIAGSPGSGVMTPRMSQRSRCEPEVSSSPKSDMTFGSRSLVQDAGTSASASGMTTPGSETKSVPLGDGEPKSGTKKTSSLKDRGSEKQPPQMKKKRTRTDTEKSTISSIFEGGFMQFQMGSGKLGSAGSSRQLVNIVTEAQSVVPSFASAFSIENLTPSPPKPWLQRHVNYPGDLSDGAQISSSYQDHLEKSDSMDIFENKEYTDTVQSTDSARSLLTRSLSVPPKYEYRPSKHKLASKEIFQDFLPGDEGEPMELEEKRKWRQTMEDLVEKPEYIDSLESSSSQAGLLARTARAISKDGYGTKTELMPCQEEDEYSIDLEISYGREHYKYLKNLIVVSVSFTLIFTAYMSLRNLQSSLNDQDGLGLTALSSVYGSLFFGCMFATTVVQRLRPKLTILISGIGFLIYTLANFYPQFYTLVPASCIAGFSLANMWTAHATYLTNIAARYSEVKGKLIQNTISKFNGIFYMFFQTSQIWGGIIASTVLVASGAVNQVSNATIITDSNISVSEIMNNVTEHALYGTSKVNLSDTQELVKNLALCGSNYCHISSENKTSPDIERSKIYTLISIYASFVVLGLLVIIIFLDPLEGAMKKSQASVPQQLAAVFKFIASRKVACLLGLMFYSLLQNSFMFGEFTKAFVTCPLGVHMVGYTMLCLSAVSAVSSYLNGKLQKYVGRLVLFFIGAAIQLSLLLFMLLWKPSASSVPVYFVIAGLWGVGDGIFITQTISLVGVLFPHKKEPAFAGLKMCQAFGATLLFVTAPYFCMRVKIAMMVTLLVLAMAGYTILEISLKRADKAKREKIRKPNRGPTPV